MLFQQATIKKVLDIREDVFLTPEEMAANLKITFFPYGKNNDRVSEFSEHLKNTLIQLGVDVLPFEKATIKLSFSQKVKFIWKIFLMNLRIIFYKSDYDLSFPFSMKLGPKIKKGIGVIATGEGKTGNLAMDNTTSFKKNPIVTIVSEPEAIEGGGYLEHMETGLNLFASHMTNLAITVGDNEWTLYSFNGSYPKFSIRENFNFNVLYNFIPKIAAPVMPPKLDDFIVQKGGFIARDKSYAPYVQDLIDGGSLLEKTGLYPKRKSVSDLHFRNNFYKWVGSIFLDGRNGMSYGFVARQLPAMLSRVIPAQGGEEEIIDKNGEIFLRFGVAGQTFLIKVPDVWVLSSRSGSDKSRLNKETDIVKTGLVGGKMIIETPSGVDIKGDYKPSFDTRVILAHAMSNAILGSIFAHFKPHWRFPEVLNKNGMALVHWHGYINATFAPNGWEIYGRNNPPVSCSSPQSAFYAFRDKIEAGLRCLSDDKEYKGDIHIEPHHGVNITYPSIKELSEFLISHPQATELGERYLQ